MRIKPGEIYSQKEQIQITTEIDNRLQDLERALNYGNYITNIQTADKLRTIDVNTATLDELRKIVATLIEDFRTVGRLK